MLTSPYVRKISGAQLQVMPLLLCARIVSQVRHGASTQGCIEASKQMNAGSVMVI